MFDSGLAFGEWLILWTVFSIVVIPFWWIFQKAGFPRMLSLLMLIPIVNIGMLFLLAFTKWPIERELEKLRRLQR